MVDERGAAIAGARLQVEYQRTADGGDSWRNEQHLYVQSDKEGSFEIRTFLEDVGNTFHERACSYSLLVGCPEGNLGERVRFEPGEEEVRVVLAAAGGLDVEPRCSDPEMNRHLSFTLRNELTGEHVNGPRRLEMARMARAAFEARYSLDAMVNAFSSLYTAAAASR